MRLRPGAAPLLLAFAASCASCLVVPDLRRVKAVDDVLEVRVGVDTREEVRRRLGDPRVVDVPELYVYDWEKSKAIFVMCGPGGCLGGPMGFRGTRASVVFDDDGRVASVDVVGATSAEPELPTATPRRAPVDTCAHVVALRLDLVSDGERVALYRSGEIRVCDASLAGETARLEGKFLGFALSADGRLAATVDREGAVVLREGLSFEPRSVLAPAAEDRVWNHAPGSAQLAFSTDGSRLALFDRKLGTVVYDTESGSVVLERASFPGGALSADGRVLYRADPKTGLALVDVASGRDLLSRAAPRRALGGGSVAFSPDGHRFALASCAHVEVWDLDETIASGGEHGLEQIYLLPFSKRLGSCKSWTAFSSDGGTLAVATEGTITYRDLAARRFRDAYRIEPMPIFDAAFSADLSRVYLATLFGVAFWQREP